MQALTEYSTLVTVVVKHVRDAFVDAQTIAAQWKTLNYTAPPDLARAIDQHDRFIDILRSSGAAVHELPRDPQTTLDSIYVRDASIVAPAGVIPCAMGKAERATEPAAQEQALGSVGVTIAGRISPPGKLEGGDLIWLDERTLAIGRGYRTNAEGIRQLRALVGESVDVVEVPLPHWHGRSDVMHLMSLISPVDRDLAVVYSRLLPVPFREWLLQRGIRLVEVPDQEFETMGTNVLALAPRRCLVLAGNPLTRRAIEESGGEVLEYEGSEISVKGAGGPTCLTRPLVRSTN
ncbi:MAG TPA: arginine deiminase family protein [Vicinamibacterales bacterium]|nr:arginine deiminase family protein [Vicinamibacterales bacterium]